MQIKAIVAHLASIAPPQYQESYDNARLITGQPDWEVTGVLTTLDCLEATVVEAKERGCNLVVAHHPIVFKGLKSLTGATYVERTIIRAIKEDVAIYAIHTNLDNVLERGVNQRIGQQLGLQDMRILSPKRVMQRMQLPDMSAHRGWQDALPESADVQVRSFGEGHEIVYPAGLGSLIQRRLASTGVDLDLVHSDVTNTATTVGSGVVGHLAEAMTERDFLVHLRARMQTPLVRHTRLLDRPVQTVAVCGGVGSFLLPQAIRAGADVFVTADYKYHEFFDADGQLVIADIGHYESEQFTINLLAELISEKFPTFAVHCTQVKTNPVHYSF